MTINTEALRAQFEQYVNPAGDMKMHRVSDGGYAGHGMNQSWYDFQAGHAAGVAAERERCANLAADLAAPAYGASLACAEQERNQGDGAARRHGMSTNTNYDLIKTLQGLSDMAYCDYIAKMKTNECLGWEEKVRTKKFGQAELTAHTKAGELLGKHRAFAEAVAALTTAAAVPPEGWVMVPKVPDERMERAIAAAFFGTVHEARKAWVAGIAAAPKAEPVPAGEYPPLPRPFIFAHESGGVEWPDTFDATQMRAYVDADRAMRAQAAPAAVASPLTKLQRKAIAVCFTSDKVSVSEVQRKLSISYADAQTLCQSIVDLGLTDELELAPSLKRGAPASQPAPVAQGDALTDTYVQQVPDKCDRIVWRGRYYHLPIDAAEHSYTEPSPMAKVAAALRQKAEQEDAAYQARRSDQGLMESEWGPMEDAPPHEDPPMHVAVVEGDDTVRTLQWNRDVAAFAYPAGTLLYAAPALAQEVAALRHSPSWPNN